MTQLPTSIKPSSANLFESFQHKDVEAVSALITRCLTEVNSRDYSTNQIAHMLPGFAADKLETRFAGTYTVVGKKADLIVAVGVLAGDEIRSVFVAPNMHGQGIGTALMDHLEAAANRNGIKVVTLYSSVTSHEFYLGRSYQELEVVNHPVGGRMYKMQKCVQR